MPCSSNLRKQRNKRKEGANKQGSIWLVRERKQEIEHTNRAEADEIRTREQEQAEALKLEQAMVAALESRGLIDLLLNRAPKLLQG